MTRPAIRSGTRSVRLVTITAVTGALLLGAGACGSGPEPSAENFCKSVTENAGKLRDSSAKLRTLAEESGAAKSVGDVASAAKSFIDLAALYDEMAKVAPPEVKADAEKVRTTFDQLSSGAETDATNLAEAAKGTLDSLRNSGEMQRLRDYAKSQCGVDLG